jgi:FAD/FMN-containing dehydrogenase/Fe-S oxidoreductase
VDERRRRIIDELHDLLDGEVRVDPLAVAMYSCDGSLYEIAPLGVAFPRHRDDVVALAKYSVETQTPLIARGAGTGIAGGALGCGIIVDFSRHMNAVEAIGEETVRVQPGIVRDRLNAVLRERGRYFPPDPSNTAITTIGGMLAVDAAGSHSVRVGSTRDHVRGIELVLAGGRVLEAVNQPLPSDEAETPAAETGWANELQNILADNEALIVARQPTLIRNCAGYFLRGVLGPHRLHLPRLLVGSEGTLGLFTSATLHTSPLPAYRGVVLLLFGGMQAAIDAVQVIRKQQPSACDLLDRRLLSLAREADGRFSSIITQAAEAALIVEQTGYSDRQVRDRIRQVVDSTRDVAGHVVVADEAYDYDDIEFLWSLPSRVVPRLAQLKGSTRPVPFVEDVAVPPATLNEFLAGARRVFRKHEVTATLYSHAAAGQVHLRPFLPAPDERSAELIENIARDLYAEVFSVGGTISGEHGDGLSRTAYLKQQYGPLYGVFRSIKTLFDPRNLMNPGKIVSDDPQLTVRNLRPNAAVSPELVPLQLQWTPEELRDEAARCNSCGHCRTQEPDLRMCPFFRVETSEETNPRSKANVLHQFVEGRLSNDDFVSDEMQELASKCFNCKQCQLECPAVVDVPRMMIEAKAAHIRAHGLSHADWVLSRAHSFAAFGGAIAFAANWAIGNPILRWTIERLFGIARKRKLPQFARRSFLRSVSQSLTQIPKRVRDTTPVVYFVDHYANYHDPELANAFVAILRHHNIPVMVPPEQVASGMAMLSAGDLDTARELAEKNLRVLAELAREGYDIVCTEPTAALCLKREYPMLLDHPDVELVASKVIEAGAYLQRLHADGKLKTDFAPLDFDAAYHVPCHTKALEAGTPLLELLSLIPQLGLHTIEAGCSGMAGAYGLTKQNFAESIRMGWGLISHMRQTDFDIGTTECSSCKLQMEQGTTKPTMHPLKLIALAYGLMPELRKRLEPAVNELVAT